MSIATVCAAIQTIGATVSGIVSAKDPPPPDLETAQLPCLYVFTGPATDDWYAMGSYDDVETRIYRIQVAVVPVGQATPETRETRCRPLLVAVRDKFAGYPTLDGLDDVRQATVLGDSGIIALPEYGGKFIGFTLNLQVKEQIRRTYAANE